MCRKKYLRYTKIRNTFGPFWGKHRNSDRQYYIFVVIMWTFAIKIQNLCEVWCTQPCDKMVSEKLNSSSVQGRQKGELSSEKHSKSKIIQHESLFRFYYRFSLKQHAKYESRNATYFKHKKCQKRIPQKRVELHHKERNSDYHRYSSETPISQYAVQFLNKPC